MQETRFPVLSVYPGVGISLSASKTDDRLHFYDSIFSGQCRLYKMRSILERKKIFPLRVKSVGKKSLRN